QQSQKQRRKASKAVRKLVEAETFSCAENKNVASYQSPFQVSPRTVTIQAEVHVISLKQEAAMAEGKLASIFTRRKGSMSPASSPRLEAEHQLPPSSLTIKRKSNVVLQEEDLELSVLESESMPKCSVVERKQFMAAFKQPSQDGSKAKTVKSQSNQKQPGDKAGDDADKVTEEDNVIPPSVEQVPAASQEDKVVKKKPTRKVKKKAKEEDEATTTPSDDAAEETVVAVGDVDDDEIEEIHITSTPSIPVVRRSKREAVIREAPELIPISPIRKTRKRNESKDTAAAAASNDSPANMSTQKRRRSKRTVFVAEMVCPPDTKESPISPVEEMLCWELLANSKRRGVDLLYSNFETLLPLPHTQLTTSTFKPGQFVSASQDHTSANPKEMPPHAGSLHAAESAECSDDSSPIKMSHRMRKSKKRHSLPDQDGLHSDSEDSFLSLCKPQDATRAKEDVKRSLVSEAVKRKPLTPEERVKNLPISQCLESIADFFDNMSYMDSLMVHPEGVDNPKRMSPVGAVVKDGMTDESRAEIDRGSWERVKHVLEIPAAVEALSFHKCQVSVAAAWDKVQQLEGEVGQEAAAELTLPVAAHQEGYSFTQDGPSQPQLVQRRREVMESLMLRGVFGTPANRPAAALDYLPALRTICRSEQLKEQGKVKRRFLHYLDAIHLGLEKSTQQQLAEDFP
uniref:ATPase family AAA domain containing 5a n=1 Tax=Cyclopterus lumpus TaxID=8103 RepID=A0A8C2YY55_CYCLU